MRITHSICLSMFIAAALAGRAFAAEGTGDLDITIRMMDARQTADEFINRIELPQHFRGAAPVTSSGPSNKGPQRRAVDKRNRDGVNDAGRDSDERGRNDIQADRPSPEDAGRGDDSSGLRDRADESHERRENFQQSSREQQESLRHGSRENWDKFRDSYPPSAWPDRQK